MDMSSRWHEQGVKAERKRCYDIVYERFDCHAQMLKQPGDTHKKMGSTFIMVDCLVALQRIDDVRFTEDFREWFMSLPKE